MSRKTHPRSEAQHRVAADNVLARHASSSGAWMELPVPVDMIVEATFGLSILWDEIEEPPDTMVLGALHPSERRIVMNTRHQDLFDRVVGPGRFTLAHELGHWLYDADDPNQLSLDLISGADEVYCYHREAGELPEQTRMREVNANKFASHLLLPERLVRAADLDEVIEDFHETAARWGVSQQTLRIRLEGLGLLDDGDRMQLDMF